MRTTMFPATYRTKRQAENAIAAAVAEGRADHGYASPDFSAFGGQGGYRAHVAKGRTTFCLR